MEIIGQNDIFLYIMKDWGSFSEDPDEKRKQHNRWSRNAQNLIKLFMRMTDNEGLFHYRDHGYLKQTVALYTRLDGTDRKSTNTSGLHLRLKYMGLIVNVGEEMKRFMEMVKGFEESFPNSRFTVYLGAELHYYTF